MGAIDRFRATDPHGCEPALSALFSAGPPFVALDDDGVVVGVSERLCEWFDARPADAVGRPLDAGALSPLSDLVTQLTGSSAAAPPHDAPVVLPDGTTVWLRVDLRHTISDGRRVRILGATDVTDMVMARKALVESERRYRLLARNSYDVVTWIRDDTVEWVSPSLYDALGWSPRDWVGSSAISWVHPDDVVLAQAAQMQIDAGEPVVSRFRVRERTGSYSWVEVHNGPYVTDQGVVDGFISTFRTINAEVKALRELERRAVHDGLTGLLTRTEAYDRLHAVRQRRERVGRQLAVLYCDLDAMQRVNHAYGHAVGDELLRSVARRIGTELRSGDFAARIGGDELLVILDGVRGAADAEAIAHSLRLRVKSPFDALGVRVSVTMSTGLAIARDGESVGDVVHRADQAMNAAKASGGDCVCVAPDDAPVAIAHDSGSPDDATA